MGDGDGDSNHAIIYLEDLNKSKKTEKKEETLYRKHANILGRVFSILERLQERAVGKTSENVLEGGLKDEF